MLKGLYHMPLLKKKSLEVYLCLDKLYKMHLGSRSGILYILNNTTYNVALEVHFSVLMFLGSDAVALTHALTRHGLSYAQKHRKLFKSS